MARFRFAYKEVNVGFIEIDADSKDKARELLECGEGDPYICDCDTEIGEFIESDID